MLHSIVGPPVSEIHITKQFPRISKGWRIPELHGLREGIGTLMRKSPCE